MLQYFVSFPFSIPELSSLCINVYLIFEAQQTLGTFGTWVDLLTVESYNEFKWG